MQFTDIMPPATQRAHFSPREGDCKRAIDATSRRPLGKDRLKCIDVNFNEVEGEAVSLHWATPGPNGYTHVDIGDGTVRPMTERERHTPASEWGLAGVLSWRRPNGDAPMTYAEAVTYAVSKGVTICAELKSQSFASVQIMRNLVNAARDAGHPPWFMALLHMKAAKEKCAAVVGAGGQFALIFGKFRRDTRRPPRGWHSWVMPTRVWGPPRTRRWAPDPTTPTPPAPKPPEKPVFPAPAPPFLGPAFRKSTGLNKPINRIVIHSTVSDCVPGGAAGIARYFRGPTAGGSAHYVVDPAGAVQTAWDSVICWHAPPNPHSLGIEMCDRPSGDKRRWKDAAHKSMLRHTARLTAELCLAYDVPAKFLSVGALRDGRHGITTHNNVSQAFHESTHWDPGAWPRVWFMHLVRKNIRAIKRAAK